MKKIILLAVVMLLLVFPAFASSQFYTFASSVGTSNAAMGPTLGLHTFYHFGAKINDRTSIGFGTLTDVDLAVNRYCSGDYQAELSFIMGPSIVKDISETTTINFSFGPAIDILSPRTGTEGTAAGGIGGTLSATFIPRTEREARHQMGFTVGVTGSALMNLDTVGEPFFFSAKAYIGFSVQEPFNPFFFYDVYGDIIEEIFDSY